MPDVDPTPESVDEAERERSRRRRDIWQLHVPLVFALILCTSLTIIEVRRAGEGVGRAWAYSFEWPLIGIVCIWIWMRYRKEGNLTRSIAAAHEQAAKEAEAEPVDPQLQEWQEYLDQLHRTDPPGQPPN